MQPGTSQNGKYIYFGCAFPYSLCTFAKLSLIVQRARVSASGQRRLAGKTTLQLKILCMLAPPGYFFLPMRLLVYGLNYAPELTGIGKYTAEMADSLVAAGHEVRVVTAPPYYPEWRVYAGYSAYRFTHERSFHGSPAVYRCPLWVPQRPGGLKRLLHLASFALSSFPVVLRHAFWKPEVIITIAPALFCAPGGWLAARVCGARAWLHIQDFEVDAAFSLGILKRRILRRAVTAIECFIMRRFDRVSTISAQMMVRLAEKGIPPERRILFPNWVDTAKIRPLEMVSHYRSRFGLDDDVVVVLYSGNMGEKQGMDVLLDAAALLSANAKIRFVLCGDGVARMQLEKKYYFLTNVIWLSLQPLEELNYLLNAADIHVLPQRADAADLVMPSKLTGMMASGKAIVAAALPETEIGAAVKGIGLLVPPGDSAAFAGAINALADDAELRNRLGAAARSRAVDKMCIQSILGRFDRDLREACAFKGQ